MRNVIRLFTVGVVSVTMSLAFTHRSNVTSRETRPGFGFGLVALAAEQAAAAQAVPDEIMIEFKPGTPEATKTAVRLLVGAALKRLVRAATRDHGPLEVAALPGGFRIQEAIRLLAAHPAVRLAEPNWIYTHQATSNDPGYTAGYLWGMYGPTTTPANQFGSRAGDAWARNAIGSHSVYVGVIDEGIDLNHPELAANIWTNPFDPADGIDNDGNGYVDDLHGWDFFQNNNSIYDGAPGNTTLDSHGTHVSGTIGAIGGNGAGVAGVNWNVTMISAKFLGPNGGTLADAIEAIDYFIDLKTRHGLNIVCLNNSWGGGGYSQALHDAIIRAAKAGLLFVAAAGNGNASGVGQDNDVMPAYPSSYNTATGTGTETAASYDAVIAVAALTSTGARASYSNYGAMTVDLGAPGSGIWSTTASNSYSQFSGTSMAAPHVTGAVALYRSMNPSATALETKNAIVDSALATPTTSMTGVAVTNGRLNITNFFSGPPPPPPPPPAPPTSLSASAASTSQINLSWGDGSTNEDGFKIERCQGAGCSNFAQINTVGAGVTTFNNMGLAASSTYRYRIRAYNAGGDSAFSNIAQATTQTPTTIPAAPSGLSANPVVGRINLSWTDNSNNEVGFRIFRCVVSGGTCPQQPIQIAEVGAGVTVYSNATTAPGTTYGYGVRAYNAAGVSGYSNGVIATAQ